MKRFLLLLFVIMIPIVAFTQGETVVPPTADEVKSFLESLGGWTSVGTMGFVVLAVQAALLVMRSSFVKMNGWYKLLIVNGLTLVGGVLALKLGPANLSWVEALLHSQTLAAFQVLGHSAIKHKKEDKSKKG